MEALVARTLLHGSPRLPRQKQDIAIERCHPSLSGHLQPESDVYRAPIVGLLLLQFRPCWWATEAWLLSADFVAKSLERAGIFGAVFDAVPSVGVRPERAAASEAVGAILSKR
jgi:hypothetical protein